MTHRSGFMLVELLIALVIASMLGGILFNAFSQTNRSVRTVDAVTHLAGRSVLVRYVMERDIAGAFIPVEGLKKKKQKEEKPQQQTVPPVAKAGEEKKPRKPITKIFYGINREGMLQVLTFITNNPLRTSVCVARVVYRLVPEKSADKRKPSYTLLRQEDEKLDYELYKPDVQNPIQAQELISGIKKMTVTYTAEITKEREEKKGTTQKKTIETEYKAVPEWNFEEQQPQAEGNPHQHSIPYAVHIELVLWDERKERERNVSFKVVIVPEMNEFEPEPKKTKESEQKQEQGKQQQDKKAAGKSGGAQIQQQQKMSSLDNTLSMLHRMLMADAGTKTQSASAPTNQVIPQGAVR